jgi:hypothetical protein
MSSKLGTGVEKKDAVNAVNSEWPTQDALLKSLDQQWTDHQHMRDQSWKSLNYSVALFGAIITATFSKPLETYVLPMCVVLVLFAICGAYVAGQHAIQQKNKLIAIQKIELKLGLGDVLSSITFTREPRCQVARFIHKMHLAMFILALATCVVVSESQFHCFSRTLNWLSTLR